MHTPLLEKAEEASKRIFQAVGICPVPICSNELIKQKQTKNQTTK